MKLKALSFPHLFLFVSPFSPSSIAQHSLHLKFPNPALQYSREPLIFSGALGNAQNEINFNYLTASYRPLIGQGK